jgi:hypothetical protein
VFLGPFGGRVGLAVGGFSLVLLGRLAGLAGRLLDRVGLLVPAGTRLGAFDGGPDDKQDRGGDQQCRGQDRKPISIALHVDTVPLLIQDRTEDLAESGSTWQAACLTS